MPIGEPFNEECGEYGHEWLDCSLRVARFHTSFVWQCLGPCRIDFLCLPKWFSPNAGTAHLLICVLPGDLVYFTKKVQLLKIFLTLHLSF